jgi:hypothetical protein
MGILAYFSNSQASPQPVVVVDAKPGDAPAVDKQLSQPSDRSLPSSDPSATSVSEAPSTSPPMTSASPEVQQQAPASAAPAEPRSSSPEPAVRKRRFSFRPFDKPDKTRHAEHKVSLPTARERHAEHKASLPTARELERREHAQIAFSQRILSRPVASKSDKRARDTALVVRQFIVGSPSPSAPKVSAAVAKPTLSKIKSQLLDPKSANKLIQHLKDLPPVDPPEDADTTKPIPVTSAPIHAVCLAHTDEEAYKLFFAKLEDEAKATASTAASTAASTFSVMSAIPVDQLSNVISQMHLISLITTPDLGIGQPGDGEGILAGAIPTAETVIKGFEQITPQLLALGYATGKAVLPDHTGVYPPLDRISVLTCIHFFSSFVLFRLTLVIRLVGSRGCPPSSHNNLPQ